LKRATFDEIAEIHRILTELSVKVSYMSDALRYNAQNLVELDGYFARAEYSFKNKKSTSFEVLSYFAEGLRP
jgi:dsDNA-specific endonuclease/ATPase MutS2